MEVEIIQGRKKTKMDVQIPFRMIDIVAEDKTFVVAKIRYADKEELVGLAEYIDKPVSSIEMLTFNDDEGRSVYWHTSAHILAQAITSIFPDSKLTIGPAIEDGFYYDVDHEPFTPEDISKIEDKMKEIIKMDIPIKKEYVSYEKAKELFKNNPFKLELIEEIMHEKAQDDGKISIYRQGIFYDLCKGPHLPSTGYVGVIKITKMSGAYWRGDANNPQLQRVYGISFPTEKEMHAYVIAMEEAAKRDHRKIGKELDLYSFHEEGPGFPFWHPKGMIIYNSILDYYKDTIKRHGYMELKTPIILNKTLWEKSGHWDHYRDNMYFLKIDDSDYAVKPMNCPGHVLIYKTTVHSYKEFPIKVAEFGLVHRHELGGVLHGLFRVRAFTQDDAHILCLPEQVGDEIANIIDLVFEIYRTFGFEDYHVELSTRPENRMGSDEIWDIAEKALKNALDKKGVKYKVNEGEGAFYGPKIDFHIQDCMGRKWQCGTIQLDFSMPETLDMNYMGSDGTTNHRPVMIHRTVLGSIERFVGILIEHYGGKLPLWLSPVQVMILPVSSAHTDFARGIRDRLRAENIRAEIDDRTETVSKRIREAQFARINYVLVIGEKEKSYGTVSVRTRDNKVFQGIPFDTFVETVRKEIDTRSLVPLIR